MTTQVLINRFLNHLRRDGKSVLTLSAYATDLKQLSSFLSPSSLLSFSPSKLADLCRKWTVKMAPNTAARKLTTLRSFLSWGYQGGYIKNDLAASVSRPKRKTISSAKPLSKKQISRLRLHAIPLERLLFELLLQTGLRLKDIVKLKIRDVNMNSRLLSLSSFNFHLSIPITGHLHQTLSYYLESKKQTVSKMLVTSPRGKHMSVRTAGAILKKLSQKAGVRRVTARNLRATFIVRQLEAGISLSTIARIVGHENLATTERYARFASRVSRREIVALADI